VTVNGTQPKLKVYLAGPMEKDHCNTTVLAAWREEIMQRATVPREWILPEDIDPDEFTSGHGYDGMIPAMALYAVANSDVILAYVDSSNRIGTFCELSTAFILQKVGYIAVLDPKWDGEYTSVLPWFVANLYGFEVFKTQEECITYLISCIGGEKVDYRTYIQSSEWRAKATAAKERAGWRCQVCNKSNEQVSLDAHHRTYERLGKELPEDITVLCRDCHGKFHGKG
jgi:hypothetical protein